MVTVFATLDSHLNCLPAHQSQACRNHAYVILPMGIFKAHMGQPPLAPAIYQQIITLPLVIKFQLSVALMELFSTKP